MIGRAITEVGQGLKPIIVVTANPTKGTSLDLFQGETLLQSKSLIAGQTEYIFVVDVSETPYVVKDGAGTTGYILMSEISRVEAEIQYTKTVSIGANLYYYSIPYSQVPAYYLKPTVIYKGTTYTENNDFEIDVYDSITVKIQYKASIRSYFERTAGLYFDDTFVQSVSSNGNVVYLTKTIDHVQSDLEIICKAIENSSEICRCEINSIT